MNVSVPCGPIGNLLAEPITFRAGVGYRPMRSLLSVVAAQVGASGVVHGPEAARAALVCAGELFAQSAGERRLVARGRLQGARGALHCLGEAPLLALERVLLGGGIGVA